MPQVRSLSIAQPGDRLCSIGECVNKHFGLGLCKTHHTRLRTRGTTDDPAVVVRPCSVSTCGEPHFGRGYCSTHYTRLRRKGDALASVAVGRLYETHEPKADATYRTVHSRLVRDLGSAADYPCGGCGYRAAEQWAYQGGALDERLDPKHHSAYSNDQEFYAPMCRTCHKTVDNATRRAR